MRMVGLGDVGAEATYAADIPLALPLSGTSGKLSAKRLARGKNLNAAIVPPREELWIVGELVPSPFPTLHTASGHRCDPTGLKSSDIG